MYISDAITKLRGMSREDAVKELDSYTVIFRGNVIRELNRQYRKKHRGTASARDARTMRPPSDWDIGRGAKPYKIPDRFIDIQRSKTKGDTMGEFPIFEGWLVTRRLIKKEDVAQFARWCNDESITFSDFMQEHTATSAFQFFDNQIMATWSGDYDVAARRMLQDPDNPYTVVEEKKVGYREESDERKRIKDPRKREQKNKFRQFIAAGGEVI